jgi:YD repeat-containing protein
VNRVLDFDYDPMGRVTKLTLPDLRAIDFGYDDKGNLTSINPPGTLADTHTFGRDVRDREHLDTPSAIPGAFATSFEYNRENQLTRIIRPDSVHLALNYQPTTGKLASIGRGQPRAGLADDSREPSHGPARLRERVHDPLGLLRQLRSVADSIRPVPGWAGVAVTHGCHFGAGPGTRTDLVAPLEPARSTPRPAENSAGRSTLAAPVHDRAGEETMAEDFLGDRKKALEESFFAKENAKLVARLKAERASRAASEALAAASGIRDAAILEKLVGLSLGPDTWLAISLVPLVEVAWADGSIDANERQAVLGAAAQHGIQSGTPAASLLESWLTTRPGPEVLRTWGEYTVAVCAKLDAPQRQALATDILGRARAVAESTGGILGLGNKVSDAEARVLAELEKAFR